MRRCLPSMAVCSRLGTKRVLLGGELCHQATRLVGLFFSRKPKGIVGLMVSEFGRLGVVFEGEPLYACTGRGVQQQGQDVQAPRIRRKGGDCGDQSKQWAGVFRQSV